MNDARQWLAGLVRKAEGTAQTVAGKPGSPNDIGCECLDSRATGWPTTCPSRSFLLIFRSGQLRFLPPRPLHLPHPLLLLKLSFSTHQQHSPPPRWPPSPLSHNLIIILCCLSSLKRVLNSVKFGYRWAPELSAPRYILFLQDLPSQPLLLQPSLALRL